MTGKKKDIYKEKKQKMQKDSQQLPAYQTLEKYCREKTSLELAQYGGTFLKGIIREFTPYEFYFCTDNGESEIHRLQIKYFYLQEQSALVQQWVMLDKSIQGKKGCPSSKPADRYKFPEGILQNDAEIMLALHEGEMIRGTVVWFTAYDIMLKANNCNIWVFRHAILDCALLQRPVTK